ncbi:transposase, partial [Eubacteriales bacterium OttesenSCG-928-K08]|nr:transposase [Eubacteriales bacterium OttesenSCG-928-K08]
MQTTFKFEPHTHTAETSKCGRIPACELVETHHALGFSSLAVTDHLHETYIQLLYCRDDWNTCVDRLLDGYRRAKARADELNMFLLMGIELRFVESDNDYLIYGADEDFLRA